MYRRPSKSLLLRILLILLPIILLVLLFLLPGLLIKISKVECESQYGDCPIEIQSQVDSLQYSNLSKTKREIMKLLADSLLVSDFSIQYSFPDKLKVNVLLKKPRFSVQNRDTGKYLMVGPSGDILGESDNSSLPTVIQSGDTPNLVALELIEGVFAMYQVPKGEIVNESLVVELPTGVRVIFPLDGKRDKDVLLGSLRLIYSEVTDREIDLRFRNALLR